MYVVHLLLSINHEEILLLSIGSKMHLIALLLFLLLTNHLIRAQGYHNISVGTTLTPIARPSSWLSPSGDFAFGFHPLETDPSLFLLSVWFDKITNKTVVWTANRDNPVSNISKVELTSDGQLSLTESTGQEIWNAGIPKASYASMLDTGNFVLAASDSKIMWQSFKNPTDTILPGQVLAQSTEIFARLLDNDYSQGRFELTLQSDGNLVLYPLAYPTTNRYDAYWASGTSGSGINHLVFNESGSIYLSFLNGRRYSVISAAVLADNYYQRATLDPDGVFRRYVFQKNQLSTGSWEVKGTVAADICELLLAGSGGGACGFNSYCTQEEGQRPVCQCPPNYSFIDPTRKYKGCKPDFLAQSCDPSDKAPFDFIEMVTVDWPLADAEQFSPMNITECKANCLKDCFCAVAIHNNLTCWKKKFPLSNGKQINDVDRQAFIKYSKINSIVTSKERDWKTWVLVGSLLLGAIIALNLVQISACFLYKRKRRSFPPSSNSIPGLGLCVFKYNELEEATKGFKEELGRGASGVVYKGVLPTDPDILIAVKKLESLEDEVMDDFRNEVKTIGQTHHKNLVRLLGFCKEGKHRLLVYEYMSNGSLYKFIFGSNRPDWPLRVQIALGIAGGLAYLHEECRTQIIHCDIKPHNILLDDNLVAKISDFGLAKLLRLHQTRTSTGVRGTIGYIAPEWFKNVHITSKVDVYSFGVMLLEIVCCRKNFEWRELSPEITTVVDWAKECCRNGRLDLLVEEDEDAKKDGLMLERIVMVGISCIQDEPWLRPSMKTVVQMLEGTVPVSLPPNLYSIHL